jgi:hypothetical protein
MLKSYIKKFSSIILAVALLASMTLTPVGALTFDEVSASEFVTYRTGENGVSSYYKNGEFYEKLTSVPKTGDGRTDALAVALSQVGYTEGDSEYGFSGTTGGSSNYTEFNYNAGDYGSGYGGDYSWCAAFMSFSLYQSGATDHGTWDDMCRENMYSAGYVWREIGCGNWANQLRYFGYYKYSAYHGGSYVPRYGDLIFFSWSSVTYDEDHIGMVVYSDGETVWTIEGNTSDTAGLESNGGGVYFKSYSIDYEYISGYGVLPYKTAKIEPIDYSGNNPTSGIYMTASGAKTLYNDFDATDVNDYLPQYSMFEVLSVAEDSMGDDMMYVKCEIDGETKYGYIVNGSLTNGYTPVVQIYATPPVLTVGSTEFDVTDELTVENVLEGTTARQLIAGIDMVEDMDALVLNNGASISADSPVGTGMELEICYQFDVFAKYKIVVKGDVDGNAKLEPIDYLAVKRHVMGTYVLEDEYLKAASIFKKGVVEAADYLALKRHLMNTYTITKFE